MITSKSTTISQMFYSNREATHQPGLWNCTNSTATSQMCKRYFFLTSVKSQNIETFPGHEYISSRKVVLKLSGSSWLSFQVSRAASGMERRAEHGKSEHHQTLSEYTWTSVVQKTYGVITVHRYSNPCCSFV